MNISYKKNCVYFWKLSYARCLQQMLSILFIIYSLFYHEYFTQTNKEGNVLMSAITFFLWDIDFGHVYNNIKKRERPSNSWENTISH